MESQQQDQPTGEKVECDEGVEKSDFVLSVSKKQYLDAKTADVYFRCGANRERIPAHKSVLSSASDAFYAMIYGPNAEEGDKELLTTSPAAFKDFLQFCYTDEVNLKVENIIEVMGLAHEYQMTECLEVCGKFWSQHLTIDDICWAYHWAIHYDVNGLQKFCERKISACPETVFKTNGFLECEHMILDRIVSLDSLSCFEISVLEACLDWARKACERNGSDLTQSENLRNYLKGSLYKIRFGSIDTTEFAKFADTIQKLFDDPEDYEEMNRILDGRFNLNPRSTDIFTWNPIQNLTWELNIEPLDARNILTSENSINFTTNQPLLLGGFDCTQIHGNKNNPDPCEILYITIVEKYKNQSNTLLHGKTSLNSKTETFVDLYEEPIVMNPEYSYQIQLKMDKCVEYSTSEVETQIKLGDKIIITIDTDEYETGINFSSAIKRFYFNAL